MRIGTTVKISAGSQITPELLGEVGIVTQSTETGDMVFIPAGRYRGDAFFIESNYLEVLEVAPSVFQMMQALKDYPGQMRLSVSLATYLAIQLYPQYKTANTVHVIGLYVISHLLHDMLSALVEV